jgi:hypothetical protein
MHAWLDLGCMWAMGLIRPAQLLGRIRSVLLVRPILSVMSPAHRTGHFANASGYPAFINTASSLELLTSLDKTLSAVLWMRMRIGTFFACVAGCSSSLGAKETLTACISGQYRGFLQVLSPSTQQLWMVWSALPLKKKLKRLCVCVCTPFADHTCYSARSFF